MFLQRTNVHTQEHQDGSVRTRRVAVMHSRTCIDNRSIIGKVPGVFEALIQAIGSVSMKQSALAAHGYPLEMQVSASPVFPAHQISHRQRDLIRHSPSPSLSRICLLTRERLFSFAIGAAPIPERRNTRPAALPRRCSHKRTPNPKPQISNPKPLHHVVPVLPRPAQMQAFLFACVVQGASPIAPLLVAHHCALRA